jgi:hypothetical protein
VGPLRSLRTLGHSHWVYPCADEPRKTCLCIINRCAEKQQDNRLRIQKRRVGREAKGRSEPRTDSSVLRAVSHQQQNVNRRFPMAAGMNGYTDYVDGDFLQSPTNPFGRVSIAKKCLLQRIVVPKCSIARLK